MEWNEYKNDDVSEEEEDGDHMILDPEEKDDDNVQNTDHVAILLHQEKNEKH